MSYNETGGQWKTIGGRKVFIREGQSPIAAMLESGKFGKPFRQNKSRKLAKKEYPVVMSAINYSYDRYFKNEEMCGKAVGEYVYLFENHGYGEYIIFARVKNDF